MNRAIMPRARLAKNPIILGPSFRISLNIGVITDPANVPPLTALKYSLEARLMMLLSLWLEVHWLMTSLMALPQKA